MKLDGGVFYAMMAAALFGLSTPMSKIMVGQVKPFMLAGLLYAGSGAGLLLVMLFKKAFASGAVASEASLKINDWPWLLGATFFGGFLGPIFLVFGLSKATASTASLLLNLEGVFTALIAWFIFKENFDKRIAAGMAFITAGSAVLSWEGSPDFMALGGPFLISAACLSWAIDNNLTKKISGGDPFQIASIKGVIAGATNLLISFYVLNIKFPQYSSLAGTFVIGFFGYGLSLVLFVLALRYIGASRTGAYFSLAPFFGSVTSVIIFRENVTWAFSAAFLLMAAGVYCHLSEKHEHGHEHEPIHHEHYHSHDDMHHGHTHEGMAELDGAACAAHSHYHEHVRTFHTHFHYPDTHHEHKHE